MSSSRVDILLALRTKLEGNAEALAYLDKFEADAKRSASNIEREWDRLGHKLERKFSLPDLSYDLLRAFGIGSAGAVVEKGIEAFFSAAEERAKAAAEEMKKFDEQLAQTAERIDRFSQQRISDAIEAMVPTDRINAKKAELAALQKQILEEGRKYSEAYDAIVTRSTLAGRLKTTIFGSPESGFKPGVGLNWIGSQAAWAAHQAFIKRNLDAQVEAQRNLLALQEKQHAVEQSLPKDAEQKAKDEKAANDAIWKEAEERRKALREQIEMGNKAFLEQQENARRELADRLKQAAAIRGQTSAEEKLRIEIEKINALRGQPGGLSAAEADAAIAKLQAEAQDLAGQAIRKAREEIESYDIALETLDRNPALSDQEKQAQRIKLLDDQTAAIKRLRKELEDFAAAHPGVDVAALTSTLTQLGDKEARNAGRTQPLQTLGQRNEIGLRDLSDPSKHYQSTGAGIKGGLQEELVALGTTGDRVAKTLRSGIGGAFDSVKQNLTAVIMQTQSWQDFLLNVGLTIETKLVEGVVELFTTWIEQRALSALASMGWAAKEGAADTAAKAPGAALSSISSFGVAAVVGIAALVAAMAAFGGFETGGYTRWSDEGRVAGVVHGKEWVAPAWMTQSREFGPAIASLEAARLGQDIAIPSYPGLGNLDSALGAGLGRTVARGDSRTRAASGGNSSSADPSSLLVGTLDPNRDRHLMEQFKRDPNTRVWFIDMLKQNRAVIPGVKV